MFLANGQFGKIQVGEIHSNFEKIVESLLLLNQDHNADEEENENLHFKNSR